MRACLDRNAFGGELSQRGRVVGRRTCSRECALGCLPLGRSYSTTPFQQLRWGTHRSATLCGSKADIKPRMFNVRFSPNRGLSPRRLARTLFADTVAKLAKCRAINFPQIDQTSRRHPVAHAGTPPPRSNIRTSAFAMLGHSHTRHTQNCLRRRPNSFGNLTL
jgi:hypothetical protein